MSLKPSVKSLTIGLFLTLAALLGWQLQPKALTAAQDSTINLEAMVPERFGDWRIDTTIRPVPPSPEVQYALDQIYSQLLERTYVDGQGNQVMVSIAYGSNQRDSMRVHPPEGCYGGQGFDVFDLARTEILLDGKPLPVSRMVAQKGNRREPVTYWVTIGGRKAVATDFQQKLAKLAYGIMGEVPDGMLVRVSSLGADSAAAYALQNRFLTELLAAMDESGRKRIFGEEF